MATKTWVGGNAGDPNSWKEALNWTGGVPAIGDDVIINFTAGQSQPILDVSTAALKSLTINAGASLAVGAFTLNAGSGGIALAGSGSTITVAGGTINAIGATGVFLAAGAVLSGFGTVAVHSSYTGSGTIMASGGKLSVSGAVASGVVMTIDSGSTSNLTLLAAATASSAIAISDAHQTLEVGASGSLTITPAESITNGTIKIDGNNARLTDTAGITLGAGSTLIGAGQVISGTGGVGLLSGSGTVEADGGTLDLVRNISSTSLNFEISNNAASVLRLDGTIEAGNTFTWLGAAGSLAYNSATKGITENIVGLNVGTSSTAPTNLIDFKTYTVSITGSNAFTGTGGTVHLSDGSVLTLSGITNSGGTWFVDTASDGATGTDVFLSNVVCYVTGTRILTATGERMIEDLVPGDIVLTLAGNELDAQPIKWIGRRRIDLATHPRPDTVAPIRIQRDAFADNAPHRDLLVSPDHAIFVDGKLICARQLLNGTTIRQEKDWTSVTYCHIELDAHAILLAEGLGAESYLDTGNRAFFASSGAPLVPYPDLTDEGDYPTREMASCAPFVWDEGNVRPIWQRLADRAATLGCPVVQPCTTTEPELRLISKGRTLRQLYGEDGRYIFLLPQEAGELRMVSRAGSPTDARPWLEDRRRLGVRVACIKLRHADEAYDLPLDHPDLSEGWWAVERDGVAMHRWTDGEAVLPLPAFSGPAMLEVRLGGKMIYADAG